MSNGSKKSMEEPSVTIKFDIAFEALTGHPPFPWQRRLYEQHFAGGALPPAVDIPTGLGKTAVMALWLLARAAGAPLPRRLVYVVDRRAVVDQATDFAERLQRAVEEDEPLAPVRRALGLGAGPLPISTLRGRHVDNREWMADPAAPAIVVGTVDMVGSRLLFEGYGLSRRMRSFAAGLLGCDTLVLLDEAHLARPFERLLGAIEVGQTLSSSGGSDAGSGEFSGPAARDGLPPPFHMLPLSATLDLNSDKTPFRLNEDDRANGIVRRRLDARKNLTVEDLAPGVTLTDVLAERAWALMEAGTADSGTPPAVAIYCDLRRDAEKVAESLRKLAGKQKPRPHVILFVGGRRVHERQKAADELQEYGLLGDTKATRSEPVFLVATSAGEVGVDLDADHMVCDLVAWERMVQRLGRVNRRGLGTARIVVLDQGSSNAKKADAQVVARREAVRALLDALPRDVTGTRQAGPGALVDLANDPARHARIADGTTPMPLYPALTRALLDAWAMTSLEDHAGRPEIAPWLRGWVEDDEPQTAVVWRRLLPMRFPAYGGDVVAVPEQDLRAFFAAAPPQTAEILEAGTSRVVDWLRKRARKCSTKPKNVAEESTSSDDDGTEAGEETAQYRNLLAPLTPNGPVAFLLDGANRPVGSLSLAQIGERKPQDLHAPLAGKRLVVDARLGGLTEGLLDDTADRRAPTIEDNWSEPEDDPERNAWTLRVGLSPNGDEFANGWQSVLAVPYGESAEGEPVSWLIVRKRRGEGESEDARAVSRKAQRLHDHHQWAGEEAEQIADALGLGAADKAMLIAAARHHDNGKAAPRWQRAFGAAGKDGPYAKTTKAPNQHVLNGFRHELKSALDAETNGLDGIGRADPRFDLALHLIAAHHGHARPTIGIGGYDALPPSRAEAGAHGIALRFARLQRQWGPWGLAWWEALLRSADQAASRRLDEET